MDDDKPSARPGGVPAVPGDLIEKIARAADDHEEARDVRLRLTVSGGVHGERHDFSADVSGAGDFVIGYLSELAGHERERATAHLPEGEFAELLRSLDVPALMKAAAERPPIPPDSLVGKLEVSDGRQHIAVTFMADPDQAKAACCEPHPAVEQAVATMYRWGARPLSVDDVRPWSTMKG